ncbi:avidin/streptavidin family protein [Bradyrhizobium elkanii]|uniref:avidin/streptavidin family protein n=1 Tax=Bradyrhizobium elkanii TaxID=29448 RepID=UPI0004B6F800|nr:avidin/streptavidin family protein [Bradyrhizobium elkanii]WLA79558.1 avidin/streptavidin family protein [Bradyrhizobium elkanii]
MLQEKSLGRAQAGTGTSVDFSGTWINELESTATLTQVNGVLSGVYESAVSAGGTSTKGDLQGYADGNLIAFVVHWHNFKAITTWVGQLDPKAPQDTINSLWQMTSHVDDVDDEWASINAGSDFFTRQ